MEQKQELIDRVAKSLYLDLGYNEPSDTRAPWLLPKWRRAATRAVEIVQQASNLEVSHAR